MSVDFQGLLLHISNALDQQQLESLKFLCKDVFGKKDRERMDSGTKLFLGLSERGKLDPENTAFLRDLLARAGREDLALRLDQYERGRGTTEMNHLDETERARLDVAVGVVSECLGRAWRKLGRRLGLSEVRLESVGRRHPDDLEETVMELLKEWEKTQGALGAPGARAEDLVKALRACEQNLTAEKVEEKLLGLQAQ